MSEFHAIVSVTKTLITWTCRDAAQECREACGGHGFLRAARLGEIRSVADPTVTYEGDNNVLSQQSSNWLLRQWSSILEGNQVASPLHTCSFLNNKISVLSRRCRAKSVDDVTNFQCKYYIYSHALVFLTLVGF